MNLGRNDPCHCGSGNKYKKCCLAKDTAASRARRPQLAAPVAIASPQDELHDISKRPPDRRLEAGSVRWKEFEAADYEGKFHVFSRTLDDSELMDGEMAFEMLDALFTETAQRGERSRFDTVVDDLRARRSEVYAKEASYFLDWRITNALVAGRPELVRTLARELAPLAGKQIDHFNRVESGLAYHGQLSTLVEAMRLAWPHVESSTDIVPWGIREFAGRAVAYEVLDHVERAGTPDSADPGLLARLQPYMEVDSASLAVHLAHLTGRAGRQWTKGDFKFVPPRALSRRDWDDDGEADEENSAPAQPDGEMNFYHLTVEFLGYLHRVEGVPYTKGELGRRELWRFLMNRAAGNLEHRESMLEAMQRSLNEARPRRPITKFRRYEHPLIPDRERLDLFLAGMLDFLNPLHYRVAATFEIVPAWLRFMESRGLIDADERARGIRDLAGMSDDLRPAFEKFPDPALPLALERSRNDAAKALPQ